MRNKDDRTQKNNQSVEEFVRRQAIEAADAYEKKLNDDPSLDDIQLTDEMRRDMMRRIAAENAESVKDTRDDILHLLPEEDRKALEAGRKQLKKRARRKYLRAAGVAAVVAALIFGASMTIEANRIRLANIWNMLLGREVMFQLKNENVPEEDDWRIQDACADILEKTGIHAIEFMYKPPQMGLEDYMADAELKTAYLLFNYDNALLTVRMLKNEENTVWGQILDGEVQDTLTVETHFGTATVMEIQGPENELDYAAELLYDNCQYTIYGILPREEFIKMIENINLF